MEKPNTFESVQPFSGEYSLKRDLRLNAWLAVAGVTYLTTLFLVKQHPAWSPLTKGLLAVAPMVPGALYVRACLRFIRGMDELQRRIQLEAWLFATLGTLGIGTIINTLDAHGVALGVLQHGLGVNGAFVLTFTLWLVGTAVANCRYK